VGIRPARLERATAAIFVQMERAMARKNLKSNKARITEDRREDKAVRATKPGRIAGIVAFCLGAITMAVAFVLTPLGAWCVTHYEPAVISVTKCDHKPQTAAKNKRSQPPDSEELARLSRARRSRKVEKRKDPMAELRRIEEINARNRRMMEQRTALPGHPSPRPTVPRPHHPATPRPSTPSPTGYVRP